MQPKVRSGVRGPVSIAEPGGLGFAWVCGFLAIHLALALVMKRVHTVAGVHALGTFMFGLWLCFGKNRPLQLAQWAGYTVGAEALWRMCKAPIPWEFAELTIFLVCLISLMRTGGIRGFWLRSSSRGVLLFLPVALRSCCCHFARHAARSVSTLLLRHAWLYVPSAFQGCG